MDLRKLRLSPRLVSCYLHHRHHRRFRTCGSVHVQASFPSVHNTILVGRRSYALMVELTKGRASRWRPESEIALRCFGIPGKGRHIRQVRPSATCGNQRSVGKRIGELIAPPRCGGQAPGHAAGRGYLARESTAGGGPSRQADQGQPASREILTLPTLSAPRRSKPPLARPRYRRSGRRPATNQWKFWLRPQWS